MSIAPISEQQRVIDEPSHCVVIARPGSGKTAVLAWKIQDVVRALPEYRGVVAISFTNKASDELRSRVLGRGVRSTASFFGTIDKFFLSEIILPFGKHEWGLPQKPPEVQGSADLDQDYPLDVCCETVDDHLTDRLGELYQAGTVVLELIGYLGVQLLIRSLPCQRYLKAKYSHIFVDEYQDCGYWQHQLFRRLVSLGLTGVAVGDLDQSIYAFARKDPRFLLELAKNRPFVSYALSENHRSHASIINYAGRLITHRYVPIATDEIRVFRKHIRGSEVAVARWLPDAVTSLASCFGVQDLRGIAVLTKSNRTAQLVHENLRCAHKIVTQTPLDEMSTPWALLFRRILLAVLDPDQTKYDLIEQYLDMNVQRRDCRRALALLGSIQAEAHRTPRALYAAMEHFVAIAELILPHARSPKSVTALQTVLDNEYSTDSYVPPEPNEARLMTLHKAKGLEFDIVFHLDLYKYILPMYKCTDPSQELNLHYVGITRAKQCCVLCTSTHRHNRHGQTVDAEPSEYITMPGLEQYRASCPC